MARGRPPSRGEASAERVEEPRAGRVDALIVAFIPSFAFAFAFSFGILKMVVKRQRVGIMSPDYTFLHCGALASQASISSRARSFRAVFETQLAQLCSDASAFPYTAAAAAAAAATTTLACRSNLSPDVRGMKACLAR